MLSILSKSLAKRRKPEIAELSKLHNNLKYKGMVNEPNWKVFGEFIIQQVVVSVVCLKALQCRNVIQVRDDDGVGKVRQGWRENVITSFCISLSVQTKAEGKLGERKNSSWKVQATRMVRDVLRVVAVGK